GKLLQITDFVLPVDLSCSNVFPPEQHVGMVVEYLPDIGFVVLGTQRDHDSAVIQIENFLLELVISGTRIGFSQFDSGEPVLAYDSAPQCIVAIQNEAFPLLALQCPHVLKNLDGYFTKGFA